MKNKMMITVKIRNVYGNERIYPVCEKAQLFARMVGAQTLTREVLAKIKELGYSVEVQAQEL